MAKHRAGLSSIEIKMSDETQAATIKAWQGVKCSQVASRKYDRPAGGLPAGVGWDAVAGAAPICMVAPYARVVRYVHWLDLFVDGLSGRLRGDYGRKLSIRDAGNSSLRFRRSLYLASDLKTASPLQDVASPMDSSSVLQHFSNPWGKQFTPAQDG